MTRRAWPVLLQVCLLLLGFGVTRTADGQQTPPPITEVNVQQLGPQRLGPLPPVVAPPNNPPSSAKIHLGKMLISTRASRAITRSAAPPATTRPEGIATPGRPATVLWRGRPDDWAGLPNNRLVTSAMYNCVRPPSNDDARRIDSYSALGRSYLGSWQAVNVALHGEYTHRATGGASGLKDDLFTVLLDFAF